MKKNLPYFLITIFALVLFQPTKGADDWAFSDADEPSPPLSRIPIVVSRQSPVKNSPPSVARPSQKPTIIRGAPTTGTIEPTTFDALGDWGIAARRKEENKESERKEQTKRLLRKSPSDTNLNKLTSSGLKRDTSVLASKSAQEIDPIVSFRKWNLVYGVPDTATQQASITYPYVPKTFFQGVTVYRTYDSATSCVNTKLFRFGSPTRANASELLAWSAGVIKSRDVYSVAKGFMNQKKQLLDQQRAKFDSEREKFLALCGQEVLRALDEVEETLSIVNSTEEDISSSVTVSQSKTEAHLGEKAKRAFEKVGLDFKAIEASFKQTDEAFLQAESDFKNEQRKQLLRHAVKGKVYELTNSLIKAVRGDKGKTLLTPMQLKDRLFSDEDANGHESQYTFESEDGKRKVTLNAYDLRERLLYEHKEEGEIYLCEDQESVLLQLTVDQLENEFIYCKSPERRLSTPDHSVVPNGSKPLKGFTLEDPLDILIEHQMLERMLPGMERMSPIYQDLLRRYKEEYEIKVNGWGVRQILTWTVDWLYNTLIPGIHNAVESEHALIEPLLKRKFLQHTQYTLTELSSMSNEELKEVAKQVALRLLNEDSLGIWLRNTYFESYDRKGPRVPTSEERWKYVAALIQSNDLWERYRVVSELHAETLTTHPLKTMIFLLFKQKTPTPQTSLPGLLELDLSGEQLTDKALTRLCPWGKAYKPVLSRCSALILDNNGFQTPFVTLAYPHPVTKVISFLPSAYLELTTLSFRNNNIQGWGWMGHLPPNVKSLDLSGNPLGEAPPFGSSVKDGKGVPHKLEQLILQNTAHSKVPNQGRFGGIRVLDLSNNPQLEDFKELERYSEIKDLRLNNCNLNNPRFSKFFASAFNLTHLTDLQLRDNNFTDLGWLPLWTHLRVLDVSRNRFGASLNFGSKFKPNEILVELRLDNTGITQISPLDRFAALEILSLSNNPGLTGIKILNNLHRLNTLSVESCALKGDLKEVFGALWSLQNLKAGGNNLQWPESEADIRQIFPIIQHIEK